MSTIPCRNTLISAFLLLAVSFPGGHAVAAAGAADFIKYSAERTFASLGEDELSDDERASRFRTLLLETFDLPKIARFTLGRYWRRASKAQRTEYVRLFEDFIVLAYSNRFRDLTGKKFRIIKVREINDIDAVVTSEIIMPDRPPVKVAWRVRSRNESFKIMDVAVEGISMSVTQRDEFASVIRSSGGRIDGLLRALRKKTGKD